jgi:hypothetical protein
MRIGGIGYVLALLLPGCVYVEQPAYQPYAYAPPMGSNAGTGAAIGAVAGGLIGSAASGPYHRGMGVVGGAAAGALLGGLVGSGIDRDNAAAAEDYTPYAASPDFAPQPSYGAPKAWLEEPPATPSY